MVCIVEDPLYNSVPIQDLLYELGYAKGSITTKELTGDTLPADSNTRLLVIQAPGFCNKLKGQVMNMLKDNHSLSFLIISHTPPGKQQLHEVRELGGLILFAPHTGADTLYLAINYLQQSQAGDINYRQIFDRSPVPKLVFDRETLKLLDINQAALDTYGYTRAEFLQLTVGDIRPPEDFTRFKETIQQFSTGRFTDHGIWRHTKKNGEIFFVNVFSCGTYINGRQVEVVVALDTDATVNTQLDNARLAHKLQLHNDRLESILNSVDEVIWTRDAETHIITDINKSCKKLYGYEPEELIGTTGILQGMIHPGDRDLVTLGIEQLKATGHQSIQYRIFDREGNMKHVLSKGVYKRGRKGEKGMVVGATMDITELTETRLKLEGTAKQMETILNSIKDGFFRLDNEWRFIYTNRSFGQITGLPVPGIMGKNYWELFPKAKDSKFYIEYKKAVTQQQPVQFEEFGDTLQRWLSVSAYPDENGISVYFTDVTRERELREKIRISEINLRAIINTTDDVIWSVDKELCLIYANDTFIANITNITGKAPRTGESVLYEHFPREVTERYTEYYMRALAGEKLSKIEEHIVNDELAYLETNFNPITDDKGDITGVSCFMRDVTERRRYIRTIEAQNNKLRDIAWLQSHKVRNHVATILGLIEVFRKDSDDMETIGKVITGIRDTASQLDAVIREINANTVMSANNGNKN